MNGDKNLLTTGKTKNKTYERESPQKGWWRRKGKGKKTKTKNKKPPAASEKKEL